MSKVIDAARYAVAIPRRAIDAIDMRARIAAVMAAESLPVVRMIDGLGKKVDVRKYLRELAFDDARARDAIERAGLVGDLVGLFVEIAITPTGSTKISEVLEVLLPREIPTKSIRVALVQRDLSPLDLEALRDVRVAMRATAAP